MNGDSGYMPEGNGCLMWLAALLVTGFVLMMMSARRGIRA